MDKSDKEFADKKLVRYESTKREFSAKASDKSSALAFAELALFWMIIDKYHYQGSVAGWGILLLLLYFLCEMLQYISGLIAYKLLCLKIRKILKKKKWNKKDINNKGINKYSNFFFWTKAVFLAVSTILLSIAAYNSIFLKVLRQTLNW